LTADTLLNVLSFWSNIFLVSKI